MNTNLITGFKERINLCRHLANRHPAWVGRVEMNSYLTGCSRTHERLLSGLVKIGYLERSNTSPAGWRVVKSKVKGFKAL
ncbi:hypothetical phage protein [Psychrobacter phage Psymv2]|uniref:hypothetical protein n=1 Tax=Psychrobacter phage Psymv2 TaxID=1071177 RepID=UPI00022A37A1|nr:hypothetical protein CJ96_gp15 [Psychrobacter phage Psymv2]AEO00996.1 hypothetical phage protein [Psychrobacter phage Psymv2]